jgi:hypothetical protein
MRASAAGRSERFGATCDDAVRGEISGDMWAAVTAHSAEVLKLEEGWNWGVGRGIGDM